MQTLVLWIQRKRGLMMIKAIAELKKTHSRMTTVLNELEVLEDW